MDDGLGTTLDDYMDHLVDGLRKGGWCGSADAFFHYCLGLLLPGERKSMEPIAARLEISRHLAATATAGNAEPMWQCLLIGRHLAAGETLVGYGCIASQRRVV